MKFLVNSRYTYLFLLFLTIAISACSTLVGKYDPFAYQYAVTLKVDSLALMDKATSSYSTNEPAIEALKREIEKAYEYANGKPKNSIVTKQWKIMKDPDRHLLGGFLVRWKDKGTFSKAFIDEAKVNVSLGFDQIIGMESGKIKQEGNN